MSCKIGIIGAGKGGSLLLPIFHEGDDIEVVGITDINPKAPGLEIARRFNIPVADDSMDIIRRKDIDVIIDVTGNPDVSKQIDKNREPHVEVIRGRGANLFWKLMESEKRQHDILHEMGIMLTSAENLKEVLDTILEKAMQVTNTPAGSLALFDKKNEEFYLAVASEGFSDKFREVKKWKPKEKSGLTRRILDKWTKEKSPLVIPDVDKKSDFDNPVMIEEGIKSLIAAPLIGEHDEIVGILYVDDFKPRYFTEGAVSFLALLATKATFAIQKIQLIEKLTDLVETCPDAVISTDEKKNVDIFNPAAEKMLGWKREEIKRKSVKFLYEDEEKAKEIGRNLHDASLRNFETELKHKDGDLIPVMISVCRLYDQKGEVIGTMGVSKDIREKKQLEEDLVKAFDEVIRNRTAVGLIHDARNSFHAISGYIPTLMEEIPVNKRKEKAFESIIKSVYDEAELLRQYFNRLVKYAKLNQAIIRENDLKEIIDDVRVLLAPRITSKRIGLSTSGVDKELKINCDKDQMEQVFVNLLLNSMYAIETSARKKEGKIEIKSAKINDNQIEIEVIDNGIGIQKENHERIFEPFVTTRKEGTGFGLMLCRQIIERNHKGKIFVKSSIFGFGTTFSIKLPIKQG